MLPLNISLNYYPYCMDLMLSHNLSLKIATLNRSHKYQHGILGIKRNHKVHP